MNIWRLKRHWHRLGEDDPLFAVLTEGEHGQDIDAFFDSGRREVQGVMDQVISLGQSIEGGRALDFGCGVGRISQALAEQFHVVYGVDIAPSMIRQARSLNQFGERVNYLLNEGSDLAIFADGFFDFVFSARTLQHIAPRYSQRYLREFVRVLRPGGLLVCQLTTERVRRADGKHRIKESLRRLLPTPAVDLYRVVRYRRPWMEMHGLPLKRVLSVLGAEGAQVLDIRTERETEWESAFLVARRTDPHT